jgi:multicomponent Na+:H+ antiporter subunit C
VSVLPYLVAGWMLVVGLYGVITSRHIVHLIGCIGVMQASTYVLFVAIGWRPKGRAPITTDLAFGTQPVDPVVQALTLTDIVVQATVTAVLLALAIRAASRFGTTDPDRLNALRG